MCAVWTAYVSDLGAHSRRKLKQDGVPTVAFSESFGEGGGSATLQYYLASAFEQIYVPEDGHVSFPGTGNAAVFTQVST